MPGGRRDGLELAVDAELGEEAPAVPPAGLNADPESPSDRLRVEPFAKQVQDLALARGEPPEARGRLRPVTCFVDWISRPMSAASMSLPMRIPPWATVRVAPTISSTGPCLGKNPDAPAAARAGHNVHIAVGGENDHRDPGAQALQPGRSLDGGIRPVRADEHHVGLTPRRHGKALRHRLRQTDALEVVVVSKAADEGLHEVSVIATRSTVVGP